jgi:formiminotetrahydrofolate cyclodeaminase
MLDQSCREFVRALASKAPVPGGGGASAYAGALGVALGSMVANLTVGKKKYEAFEEDMRTILKKSEALQSDLMELVSRDAQAFEPLAKAYGMPRQTEQERRIRSEVMEEALVAASLVPLEIMEKAYEGVVLQDELALKGSRIAISDVGVGVQLLKAAILGASMNVLINTKSMENRSKAQDIEKNTMRLISHGTRLADQVYRKVEEALHNE